MVKSIRKFIDSIAEIGELDESVYDTAIKEEILLAILKEPTATQTNSNSAFSLQSKKNTNLLRESVSLLLEDFHSSETNQSLESTISAWINSLPRNSKYRVSIDEIFGDHFDENKNNKKILYKPLRNFFYSNTCSNIFMLTPAIGWIILSFSFYPYSRGAIFIIVTLFIALCFFVLGDSAYEIINKKIQKYEGVI